MAAGRLFFFFSFLSSSSAITERPHDDVEPQVELPPVIREDGPLDVPLRDAVAARRGPHRERRQRRRRRRDGEAEAPRRRRWFYYPGERQSPFLFLFLLDFAEEVVEFGREVEGRREPGRVEAVRGGGPADNGGGGGVFGGGSFAALAAAIFAAAALVAAAAGEGAPRRRRQQVLPHEGPLERELVAELLPPFFRTEEGAQGQAREDEVCLRAVPRAAEPPPAAAREEAQERGASAAAAAARAADSSVSFSEGVEPLGKDGVV